jgi:hypothetical protein
MSSITGWQPLRTALIISLPYLLICEVLYFWYSSGFSSGFLIGGFLLTYLLMPSWILFGRSAYYAIQDHTSTYLDCHNEAFSVDATRAFLDVQADIGITVLVVFLCIFLPIFFIFIITKLFNRGDLRQPLVNMKSIENWPSHITALLFCLPYLLICEALFWYLSGSPISSAIRFLSFLLFTFLTLPSYLIFGTDHGYRTREYAIQYLGCQSEPSYEIYNSIIGFQVAIFNNLALIFMFVFFTKYLLFIVNGITKK